MADDNNEMDSLVSLLSRFENTSDHPEMYLKPPVSLEKDTVASVKQIFDFCKKDEPNGSRSLASTCPLQELLVEDFDVEQIWQEIELQNTPLLRLGKEDVQNIKQSAEKLSLLLAARKSEFVKGYQLQGFGENVNANGFVRHSSGNESEGEFSDGESSHDENSNEQMDNADDNDKNEDYDENIDDMKVSQSSRQHRKQKPAAKKSQVDDTFFKLSDMVQFLNKEDRKFERMHQKKNQTGNDDNDSDESESELVDYFMEIDSDNTDNDEDDDWNKALDATKTLLGRCISA